MKPNEAVLPENKQRILEHQEKYKLEFSRYNRKPETLHANQNVLIKNGLKNSKKDDAFKDKATIVEKEKGNIYKVIDTRGKILRKHISQLKGLREGKLDIVGDKC
ncbi:MAG: hypothetical protein ACRDD8_11075 [Bacteroidales bacterium]